MLWVLLILVVIVTAFLVPKFGKVLLGVIGVLILIGVLWYLSYHIETEASKKRIVPSEIKLTELTLVPGRAGTYTTYKLQGRIKNMSSAHILESVQLTVTIQDCIKPQQCEVVGERWVTIWHDIPPGQTRAVDQFVIFSDMPAFKGQPTWHYAIQEIRGK